VLLRLGAGGICGSDLHYYKHGRVGAFVMREPLVPGHEASGVVDARRQRRHAREGRDQKVAINPSHPCGRCDYCRAGPRQPVPPHVLPRQRERVPAHAQGMFRERFVMGEAQLTPITKTSRWARSPAPSRCRSACTRCTAPALLGETVLITGGGTIGCMSVIAARLAGAAQVIVCDIADRALEIARRSAPTAVRSDQVAAGRAGRHRRGHDRGRRQRRRARPPA
jgi:L-idonate 5-dehydrogenase